MLIPFALRSSLYGYLFSIFIQSSVSAMTNCQSPQEDKIVTTVLNAAPTGSEPIKNNIRKNLDDLVADLKKAGIHMAIDEHLKKEDLEKSHVQKIVDSFYANNEQALNRLRDLQTKMTADLGVSPNDYIEVGKSSDPNRGSITFSRRVLVAFEDSIRFEVGRGPTGLAWRDTDEYSKFYDTIRIQVGLREQPKFLDLDYSALIDRQTQTASALFDTKALPINLETVKFFQGEPHWGGPKVRQITLRQEVFEPQQEKLGEIIGYFKGLDLKEFFSAFGEKPKAIAIGNFDTGPGSILPDYTYLIDLKNGVAELKKFYENSGSRSEKKK